MNLVSDETVESSKLLVVLARVKTVLSSKWIKIGAVLLGVLIVFYIIVSIAYNIKKKKLKSKNGGSNQKNYKNYR